MTIGDQRAAVGRLLDYYQHAAGRAQALITASTRGGRVGRRGRHDEDALAWLRAERASLLACLDHATARRMPERVVALTAGISELLRRDGPSAEAVTRQERAVRTAGELADRPGQASALRSLGDAHWLTRTSRPQPGPRPARWPCSGS